MWIKEELLDTRCAVATGLFLSIKPNSGRAQIQCATWNEPFPDPRPLSFVHARVCVCRTFYKRVTATDLRDQTVLNPRPDDGDGTENVHRCCCCCKWFFEREMSTEKRALQIFECCLISHWKKNEKKKTVYQKAYFIHHAPTFDVILSACVRICLG